jgi:hypothetical protein
MSEQQCLFEEMQLQPGDFINNKGRRLFFRDIYKDMLFVQDHGTLLQVCKVIKVGEQILYSDGSRELCYTRPEYIDYQGKGFESCLFYAIPENFKKKQAEL